MTQTAITREKLTAIGEELTQRHLGDQMREITLGGILCMLSKRHMLLYGPHGANKSRIIEDLCSRIDGATSFINAGSAYSVVEDILGPIKLSGLDHDIYERNPEGRIQQAHFAFLDEVCEMNDAIVKVLHSIVNAGERKVNVGGRWETVPIISVFGATNVTVEDAMEGKAAFMDRWHLRFHLEYPDDPDDVKRILKMAHRETTKAPKKTTITIKDLAAAHKEVEQVKIPEDVFNTLTKILKQLTAKGVEVSPRRMVHSLAILQASAWFRDHEMVDNSDLAILRHMLWTEEKHVEPLQKILAVEAKSHISQAKELLGQVERLRDKYKGLAAGSPNASKVLDQIHAKAQKLSKLEQEYAAQGKDTREISKAYEATQKIHYELLRMGK